MAFKKKLSSLRHHLSSIFSRLKKYLRHLLFPIYLFPVKLITYGLYYLIKLVLRLLISMIKIIIDMIIFPFRSLKNFLKTIFILSLIAYILVSLFVMADYIVSNYGRLSKFMCEPRLNDKLRHSVVRIVGGYSEGSGFFIGKYEILTSFHVINGEPSPKIIFSDGTFTTAKSIVGDKDADLAIITIDEPHPDKVLALMYPVGLTEEEPLTAAGYALGSDITGDVTITSGKFIALRKSRQDRVGYVQTNISLVGGMSGGPLVDKCGEVVGVNTSGLAGTSFFIATHYFWDRTGFSDTDVAKINLDPSASPEEAVTAFYTYLKARDMKNGFDLLSAHYKAKTNFEEWTNRFTNVIDVEVVSTEKVKRKKDIVFVKFTTRNWVDGEAEDRAYEGTWQTVLEDGKYKMYRSRIQEVFEPSYTWFYE